MSGTLSAAIGLASTLSIFLLPRPATANEPLEWARVDFLRNRVQLIPSQEKARRARISDILGIGDSLRTARSSRAELRFSDGSLARIGERATFRFTPNTRNFQLNNGTVLLLIPPERGRTTIQTPNAVTGIQGSALFVRYISDTDTTIVGALTNNPNGPMVLFNRDGTEQQALRANEIGVIQGDQITQLYEFDSALFWQSSGLADGFNINDRSSTGSDELDAVREEIREAISSQGSFDSEDAVENPKEFSLPPLPDEPSTQSDAGSADISVTTPSVDEAANSSSGADGNTEGAVGDAGFEEAAFGEDAAFSEDGMDNESIEPIPFEGTPAEEYLNTPTAAVLESESGIGVNNSLAPTEKDPQAPVEEEPTGTIVEGTGEDLNDAESAVTGSAGDNTGDNNRADEGGRADEGDNAAEASETSEASEALDGDDNAAAEPSRPSVTETPNAVVAPDEGDGTTVPNNGGDAAGEVGEDLTDVDADVPVDNTGTEGGEIGSEGTEGIPDEPTIEALPPETSANDGAIPPTDLPPETEISPDDSTIIEDVQSPADLTPEVVEVEPPGTVEPPSTAQEMVPPVVEVAPPVLEAEPPIEVEPPVIEPPVTELQEPVIEVEPPAVVSPADGSLPVDVGNLLPPVTVDNPVEVLDNPFVPALMPESAPEEMMAPTMDPNMVTPEDMTEGNATDNSGVGDMVEPPTAPEPPTANMDPPDNATGTPPSTTPPGTITVPPEGLSDTPDPVDEGPGGESPEVMDGVDEPRPLL
ncbi:MAG: FecR domain-containing protein [Cyanobacteria bacterium P01_A01_bin.116]